MRGHAFVDEVMDGCMETAFHPKKNTHTNKCNPLSLFFTRNIYIRHIYIGTHGRKEYGERVTNDENGNTDLCYQTKATK